MKKSTFFTLIITKGGEKIAQDKTGYTFTEYGYTFNLYKIGAVWCVLEASTGLKVCQTQTLKEAPGKVLEYIDTLNSFFSHVGEQTKEAIKIIADATNKAQVVNGETAAKEETKTEKPAKNVIKRDTTILSSTLLTDTAYSAKGDIIDAFKDRAGWTGINRRTGKITLFAASILRNGEVFRIDAQRPEPTTENITRLLDAGKEEEARKELFALLVVSGERALAETNRAHGEILETAETKELLEKIASEAEKTTVEYFTPAHTQTTDTEKPADVLKTETEKAPIQDGEKTTDTRANIGKVWKPCTMSNRAYYGKIYSDNMRRNGTRKPAGILPTDASPNRIKSFLSGFNIYTLTSIGLTDKKPATKPTRSDTGIRSGRTTDTNRQARNGETLRRGKVKPRGHPKIGITA